MDVARLVQLKSLIGGGILLVIILLIGVSFNIDVDQIIPIIILGVLGVAFSLYLYLQAIKRIGVAKSSSLLSLSAAFGLSFAAIMLLEPISVYQLVAIGVMFVGIYIMYKNEVKMEVLR
jgi:drug/metabolite transporter (DMT)-like permease